MKENRRDDYLEHIRQAASDALIFVEGLNKDEFAEDKRTQQAVIMSLIIIGEAATKIMDRYPELTVENAQVPWRSMRGMRKSNCSRLFRYQSGRCLGNRSGCVACTVEVPSDRSRLNTPVRRQAY